MTAVRDLVINQVSRAGVSVNEVHEALMVTASPERVAEAQRLAARMAEDAAALAVALSDVEVRS